MVVAVGPAQLDWHRFKFIILLSNDNMIVPTGTESDEYDASLPVAFGEIKEVNMVIYFKRIIYFFSFF